MNKPALVIYYSLLVLGYGWSFVQLIAQEPFDAAILFWVTYFLHLYRNIVKREYEDE